MATTRSAEMKSQQSNQENIVNIDRRRDDRRAGVADAGDTGGSPVQRRKNQRRRHIDPTTCERDYNEQEIEFMRAMDDYKRQAGRMFPTCSEVLEVIRGLGYVQLSDDQIEELGLDVIDEPSTLEDCDEELAEV